MTCVVSCFSIWCSREPCEAAFANCGFVSIDDCFLERTCPYVKWVGDVPPIRLERPCPCGRWAGRKPRPPRTQDRRRVSILAWSAAFIYGFDLTSVLHQLLPTQSRRMPDCVCSSARVLPSVPRSRTRVQASWEGGSGIGYMRVRIIVAYHTGSSVYVAILLRPGGWRLNVINRQ